MAILQDLRYGLRSFLKSPGFTAVAVVVLALGIGANTAIFTIVNQLLFEPLSPVEREWVGVYSHDRTKPDSYRGFSYPTYVDIRDRSGVFAGLMAHDIALVGLPAGDTTRRTMAAIVSSNYFETLGVSLMAGRTFTTDEERPGADLAVAVVPHSHWIKHGRSSDVLGSVIRVNARDFTIVGIAPEGFTGTIAIAAPEVYLPLGVHGTVVNDLFKKDQRTIADRSTTSLILAGRLKPALGATLVDGRLDAFSKQLEEAFPAEQKDQRLTVRPLPRLSMSPTPQSNSPIHAFAALLLSLSGVVLLIACLNLANMLLARGTARKKEMALRLALGASRRRVVAQLLTEGLTLAAAGAALGLALSYWATQALAVSLVGALPMEVRFDPVPDGNVLGVTAAIAALSTIAFGLGPALRLSRRDLVTDLKDLGEDRSVSRRFFTVRNLMVVGQVSLSLALLVAAGIFTKTATGAAAANPGYSYERLVLASLDPGMASMSETRGKELYRAVLQTVRALPGVTSAGLASTVPFGDTQEGRQVERLGAGATAEPARARTFRIITAGHFEAIGLPMVRGREFTSVEESSAEAPGVCIIDEVLARQIFGADDPIGQLVRVPIQQGEPASPENEPMLVVGIAPPIREELLEKTRQSHVYVPFGRHYRSAMHLQARLAPGGDEAAAAGAIRQAIRSLDPRLPILAVTPMQSFHDRSLELWALQAGGRLFATLGVLALTLAVVGVYGVKAYMASQRRREIGIRMALGASREDVLRLLFRDGATLTIAGLVVGVPLSMIVSMAFATVFVDVGGIDPVVIALAAALLAVSALAASAVPAWRAARVAPLTALRAND